MSWLSRFREARRPTVADGDQVKSKHEQTEAVLGGWTGPITVAGSQNVIIGDGTVQNNVYGPDPGHGGWGDLGGQPGEEPPDDWNPGDEADDEGGMSEVHPMDDTVAREEAAHFWPEPGQ